ncbi:hypothetical protein OG928_22685 [Embleya sp. NBC_00896]|nr:hypothetical protein OG928_22685 [Embleya sp. NBC_00896]
MDIFGPDLAEALPDAIEVVPADQAAARAEEQDGVRFLARELVRVNLFGFLMARSS